MHIADPDLTTTGQRGRGKVIALNPPFRHVVLGDPSRPYNPHTLQMSFRHASTSASALRMACSNVLKRANWSAVVARLTWIGQGDGQAKPCITMWAMPLGSRCASNGHLSWATPSKGFA